MSACRLTPELIDQGINIKKCLKSAGYEEDAAHIDNYLCQYDYKNIYDKLEMISSILYTFNSRRCCELFIPESVVESIEEYCNKISQLKMNLEEEMKSISFDGFIYNDREYILMRDAFNWILNEKWIVVLLKENGEFFNDNLVALNPFGKVMWSSLECIECKDRIGASFVDLKELSGDYVCANTYVGINYSLNAMTGEIYEKEIVK